MCKWNLSYKKMKLRFWHLLVMHCTIVIVHKHSLASWALHFSIWILLPQVKIYPLASLVPGYLKFPVYRWQRSITHNFDYHEHCVAVCFYGGMSSTYQWLSSFPQSDKLCCQGQLCNEHFDAKKLHLQRLTRSRTAWPLKLGHIGCYRCW